jgi:Zn-dependent protease with chaperone function
VNEDKATRYQRLKRRAAIGSFVWNVALLAAIVVCGASVALRAAAELVAPAGPLHETATVALYVVFLALATEIAGLPLAFYSGYLLERRYGLSNEPLRGWAIDQLKSFAIFIVFGVIAATVVYAFIRRSPEWWWLPAGAVFAVLVVGLANLAPVLLLPLFYRVRPLEREALRQRLLALAERAGARVLGAYEWGLAEKTRKANAALAGLGATRRILVSDTMLAEYSEDEIEVVLAHELAHHVHGDIWKGLIFESALIFAGCFAAARLLAALAAWARLRGPADPAGIPLLLAGAGAVSLVMLPAAYALSRAHERRADRFALELTRNPAAFISAMRRLSAQNLAEDQPSKVVQWLFYSHPPIGERIAAAQAFRPPVS